MSKIKLWAWTTDHLGKCIHQIPYYRFTEKTIEWGNMRKWDKLTPEEKEYVLSNPAEDCVDWSKFPLYNKCDSKCPTLKDGPIDV